MSAVTQNEYTGNGSTTTYSFTFPYLKTSDIKASLDAVDTTAFTLANATTLQFNTAPANGVKIKIFRETGVDNLTATFYAGSAIKSEDLNDNFTQNLFVTQEVNQRYLSTLGGTMTGDLGLGEDAKIVFEGATNNANETTLTVVDPTADRTITFPNVTGNVVTTGDTGTVATGMIAADAVTGAKIADDQINSEHYVDGSIDTQHIADAQVTEVKIASGAVTNTKIANNTLDEHHYQDGSIKTVHITDANITTAKIASGAVTNTKIADNAIDSNKLAANCVNTSEIVGSAVTTGAIADDAVTAAKLASNSVVSASIVDNAVTLAKMADNSVGTSEIVNDAVTTAKIAANAVTNNEIGNDAIDSRNYVDGSIDLAHLANASVDNSKLADNAVTTAKIANAQVNSLKLADQSVTTAKIPDNQITTAKIADAELKTLAGMQSGTASKLADSTALTADIADLNQIDGLTKQTTISDSDASFPTSGAVVDYVAAQIAPLGGLEVIATEVAFPNTQPQAGVVISISDAGGVVFNGSGTSTTGRTVGGSTVTINNAPSSLNNETLVAGVGLMVSSTGSGQIYNYHKILGKEDDIKQLSDDINDFNARYRVGSSNPTSALDAGDLFFNTSTSKLLVYNATNSAWEEAQSIGNFFISTFSEAFDGSRTQFTISNAPTNVQQILLSLNGVVQKPGTAFTLSGSTVTLASAPASGTEYFAVVMGSTVNIGQPSNDTVSTAILQNSSVTTAKIADDAVDADKLASNSVVSASIVDGSIVNADINASAAIDGTKISPSFTSDIILTNANPSITLLDSDANSDFKINVNGGIFSIKDQTNTDATRLGINSNGHFGINTETPLSTLQVKTPSTHNGTLRLGGSSADLGFLFEYDQASATTSKIYANPTYTNTGAVLKIGVDGDANPNQLVLKGNGKIGIGTSAPEVMLDIRANDPGIQLVDTGGTSTYGNIDFVGDTLILTSRGGASSDGIIDFRRYDGTTVDTSMRINSVGRVAIGTTNPLASLHIKSPDGSNARLILEQTQDLANYQNGIDFKNAGTQYAGIVAGKDSSNNSFGLVFHTGSSFTSRMQITDGGDVAIINGNLQLASGKGIDFSATADGTGSNQAELFDDYEEGTWTPAIVSGSGSLTVHSAKYTKIGRSVFIQFYFTISGTGSNSNNAQFSGLPFTVQANGWTAAALNTGFSSAGIHCRANQASTQIDIKTTADTAITFAQLNSTWILSGIHYFTDS